MQGLFLMSTGEVHTGWLTGVLLGFARGGAEWVLWLLVLLSLATFVVFLERFAFYRRYRGNSEKIRQTIMSAAGSGRVDEALKVLEGDDSMQARVVAYGLREAERGPDAVQELCRGAVGIERLRYERGLQVLATVGSNAPFIGLFGTVMGVIMAFDALRSGGGSTEPTSAVMGAIAEALVATGVGLLVAIPAILFFNLLKGSVKRTISETQMLVETMVAYLRGGSASKES